MFISGGKKCEEGLVVGTEIGMSFKLPDVVNSEYGSASKLCGLIPMLLPYGHYKHPAILEDPKRLEEFIQPKLREYIDVFPNDTDEEIKVKILGCTHGGIRLYPRQNFDTPIMELFLRSFTTAVAMDDIYDLLGDNEKFTYSGIKKMGGMYNDMVSGVYKSAADIPSLIPALDTFRHYMFKTMEMSKELVPGYNEKNEWFKIEMVNALRASILLRYREEGGKTSYSSGGKAFFGGYQNGLIEIIEVIALLENIELNEKIRSDIVFQKLKADVGIAGFALNDVYGIVRDIEQKNSRDTHILINVDENGIPLQSAFDITLKTLTDAMSDAKISIKLLKEYYSDDQQLLNYISCLEDAVDGQIYSYAGVKRYGESNSKIVTLH